MSEFAPRGTLSVSFGEACDRGKVREENQDSIRSASIPLGDIFIVADGIGGYQGGSLCAPQATLQRKLLLKPLLIPTLRFIPLQTRVIPQRSAWAQPSFSP
jgi:serine/threonine protein phosphatase PrpC